MNKNAFINFILSTTNPVYDYTNTILYVKGTIKISFKLAQKQQNQKKNLYYLYLFLKISNTLTNCPIQITVNTIRAYCFSPSWLGADFVGADFVRGRVC